MVPSYISSKICLPSRINRLRDFRPTEVTAVPPAGYKRRTAFHSPTSGARKRCASPGSPSAYILGTPGSSVIGGFGLSLTDLSPILRLAPNAPVWRQANRRSHHLATIESADTPRAV